MTLNSMCAVESIEHSDFDSDSKELKEVVPRLVLASCADTESNRCCGRKWAGSQD